MSKILESVQAIEADIIRIRRELHMHPELSGQELGTSKRVALELDQLGIPYKKIAGTSLLATLKGTAKVDPNTKSKTILLRADIDALPIKEETDVPFKSTIDGVMHACGHDAHTAMLLGAIKVLQDRQDQFHGEIRFIFQEAEETLAGANAAVREGAMDGVDACFAMHGMNSLKTGEVSIVPGYRLSGADVIKLRFEGVSGHAATPELSKDTIHPAAVFVADLQSIIAKNISALEPLVLTVGRFHGGTQANIVPKTTEVDISMRYFSDEVRAIAHEQVTRHAKSIAEAYGITVDVKIETGSYSIYNDEALSKLASMSAEKILGTGKNINLPRAMNSEDMAYYMKEAPGVYAFIGYYNEEKGTVYPPHHHLFKLDEDYFKYGSALFVQFALDFLNEEHVC